MAPDRIPRAVLIFLRCWVRLYGAVSLEIFGHLRFALDDAAPHVRVHLAELAELLGLEYPLPPLRRAAGRRAASRGRRTGCGT